MAMDDKAGGLQRLSQNRLDQFRALQYGMFIHFGMTTFHGITLDGNARRIIAYDRAPVELYKPTALDVEQWVRVASEAGMKYLVLTAKHHTGFCLWPSAQTAYHVGNSADKTDVIAAFVKACRKYGMKIGLYYACWDECKEHRFGSKVVSDVGWGPDYTTHEYRQFQLRQIEELLTGYGPIDEFWIDIPRYLGPEGRQVQYDQIARLQPECIISYNQGFSSGDTLDTVESWPTDICTMERRLPSNPRNPVQNYNAMWHLKIPGQPEGLYYIPGEVCDTIGRSWFHVEGDVPRSDAELLGMYLVCRERGVNFLFNVPPDQRGIIPEMHVSALMRLKANLSKLGM